METWYDNEVIIKRNISFAEMLSFVNDIVLTCFDDKHGFMPELMDFAVRSNILTRYANFNLPDNLETRYDMLYNTDAVEFVLNHINMNQLQELINSANRKINHLCNTNVMDVQKRMDAVVRGFEEIKKNTEAIFNGVNPDDFGKLMNAFAEHGELDEKKIVDALMEHRTHDTVPEAEQDAVQDSTMETDGQ